MIIHAKALLAFLAFHVIVTAVVLLFNQVPQALGQGANDNDTQLVGAVLWAFLNIKEFHILRNHG